jgi:hypothetical protein
MTKGEIVGNIVVIDVKDRGRLHMSKINIAKMSKILLQDGDCFWIFDAQFGYPIFEGIFTLHT